MSPHKADQIYNFSTWSEGYFDVDTHGQTCVAVTTGQQKAHLIPLATIAQEAKSQGLQLPLLVRFPHILRHRVKSLCEAFQLAIQQEAYEGQFTPIYPIKVNQQRRVVEEIVKGQLASSQPARLGLEAGSKPELLAILTEAHQAPTTIVCNGYKDKDYIELALVAEKLGHKTFIVIEKAGELDLVLAKAAELGVAPRVGFRARLASIGKGNWQNTGGEKSKFGLTAAAILTLIGKLKASDQLSALQMLHFHLGSQIANIQDIHQGMQECARFYIELRGLGAPVDTVDVGGGLGVDYEGTRSRSACSMNYSLEEYAQQVVHAFANAAKHHNLPQPHIMTESGRAVTAHHAVLIADTIDEESKTETQVNNPAEKAHLLTHELHQIHQQLESERRPLTELYHHAIQHQETAKQAFSLGQVSLTDRADIETRLEQLFIRIREKLDVRKRPHREIFDHLNEVLADKLFVNFSLFQSLPDVWAIDQIFPILPLKHLNEPITRRAVIQDITCDSDGRIDLYVDGEGVETSLPLPEVPKGETKEPLGLAFFMVGAYQEILGDMHNLFGDADSVDAYFDNTGSLTLDHLRPGDSMASVLAYVDFNPEKMLATLTAQVESSALSVSQRQTFLALVKQTFANRTYLTPDA